MDVIETIKTRANKNLLLKLLAEVNMYDGMSKPLSASESIIQVSVDHYIQVAKLALEQQAEIEMLKHEIKNSTL
jgi:hypothetical protein